MSPEWDAGPVGATRRALDRVTGNFTDRAQNRISAENRRAHRSPHRVLSQINRHRIIRRLRSPAIALRMKLNRHRRAVHHYPQIPKIRIVHAVQRKCAVNSVRRMTVTRTNQDFPTGDHTSTIPIQHYQFPPTELLS